jgi:hypothetical protein
MKFWGAVAPEVHMAIRCQFFFLFEGDNIEWSDAIDFILSLCGVSLVWGILLIPNYCLQNKNFEGNPE